MRRALILIGVFISGVSCDVGRIRADGRPVQDVWGAASPEVRISTSGSPLRMEREIPLLSAPEVFAVYVPSRLDRTRDLLLGEHWIYFRLRDGEWFVEQGLDRELPATEAATSDDLLPLKSVEGMDRMVTPWKEPRSP
jgi:hypothetical protein